MPICNDTAAFYAYILFVICRLWIIIVALKLTIALKVAVDFAFRKWWHVASSYMFLLYVYEFLLLASILRRSERIVHKQASINLNSQPDIPTFLPRSF